MRGGRLVFFHLSLVLCVGLSRRRRNEDNACLEGGPCENVLMRDLAETGITESGLSVSDSYEQYEQMDPSDLGTTPKGALTDVNVTVERAPRVRVLDESKGPNLSDTVESEHIVSSALTLECDSAMARYDRAVSTWNAEEQLAFPRNVCTSRIAEAFGRGKKAQNRMLENAKASRNAAARRNQNEAVEIFRNVSELAAACSRAMAKTRRSLSKSQSSSLSVKQMILVQQAFRCCADAIEGSDAPCSINPEAADVVASSLEKDNDLPPPPPLPPTPPSWISCEDRCSAEGLRRKRRQRANSEARERARALTKDAMSELGILFGAKSFPHSDGSAGDDDAADGEERLLVGSSNEIDGPDTATLFYMGCMQGCAGRIADSSDRRLRQVGCEDHLERSRCTHIQRCRWDEARNRCTGLRRRCELYCDSVVNEPRTTESAKFNRRADSASARHEWVLACQFGCEVPRRPRGKFKRRPCRRVDPCEVDPDGCEGGEGNLRFRGTSEGRDDEDCEEDT